jgi:hypothetical protein
MREDDFIYLFNEPPFQSYSLRAVTSPFFPEFSVLHLCRAPEDGMNRSIFDRKLEQHLNTQSCNIRNVL